MRNRNNGFTLVEMSMAVTIMTILFLVLARLFSGNGFFTQRTFVRNQMLTEQQQAFFLIKTFLSQADPQSVTLTSTALTSVFRDRLTFNLCRSPGAPVVQYQFFPELDTPGTTWRLVMMVGLQKKILARNVSSVKFWYSNSLDTSLIGVHISLEKYRQKNPVRTQVEEILPTGNC